MIINLLLAFALGAIVALALTSRAVARKEEALRRGAEELQQLLLRTKEEAITLKAAQRDMEAQGNTLMKRIQKVTLMEQQASLYHAQATLRQALVGLETASSTAEVEDVLRVARESMPPTAESAIVAFRFTFVYVKAELLAQCRTALLLLLRGEQKREDRSQGWEVVWHRWLDAIREINWELREDDPEADSSGAEERYWECKICGADLRDKPGPYCGGCKRYELDSDR